MAALRAQSKKGWSEELPHYRRRLGNHCLASAMLALLTYNDLSVRFPFQRR